MDMEKVCCVFGAGAYGTQRPEAAALSGALAIAADGGYAQMERWGIEPHLVVGDFDSLGRIPQGVEVVRHPVMKDDTDMMLAVEEGLARGCGRFLIYGGLGGRLDHALANLHILAMLARRRCPAFLLGADCAITAVCGGTLAFAPGHKGTISIFAWGGAAKGISLTGLLYPLEDAELSPERPLGVSNEFTGQAAKIRVADGTLIVLWRQEEGRDMPVHR